MEEFVNCGYKTTIIRYMVYRAELYSKGFINTQHAKSMTIIGMFVIGSRSRKTQWINKFLFLSNWRNYNCFVHIESLNWPHW